jgi:hypothetical protein
MNFIGLAGLLLLGNTAAVKTATLEDDANSLRGVKLEIVVVEDYPFVKVREDPLDIDSPMLDKSKWSGFIISFIDELSAEAGFDYELHLPSGGSTLSYGAGTKDTQQGLCRDDNGCKVPGQPDQLSEVQINGETSRSQPAQWKGWNPDVMISAAYITTARSLGSTMTAPFTKQPLALMVRAPPLHWSNRWGSFLDPFSTQLWALIACSIAISAFVFLVIEGSHPACDDFGGRAFKSRFAFMYSYGISVYLAFLTLTGLLCWSPKTGISHVRPSPLLFLTLVSVSQCSAVCSR